MELGIGQQILIPPGQFALLLTEEVVTIPHDTIALISIKAGIKFKGLVNVSGFHVDPGYSGRLMFAVYNAGSSAIPITRDARVFLIWFSNLDGMTSDPYVKKGKMEITDDDVSKIQGELASPPELQKQINELKTELHAHGIRLHYIIVIAIGLLIALATFFLGTLFSPTDNNSDIQEEASNDQSELIEKVDNLMP